MNACGEFDLPRRLRWPTVGAAIAFAAIATLVTGILWITARAREQLKAIDEVERLGVFVTVDPPGPYWLHSKLPEEWIRGLGRISRIEVDTPDFAEEDLSKLSPLKAVDNLKLTGSKFSDAGMKLLAPLTNLTYLALEETDVTDAGLKELETMPNLTHVAVYRSRITEDGAKSWHRSRSDRLFMEAMSPQFDEIIFRGGP